MAWVDGKAFRFFLPALADVLIRRKSLERFESLCEIIGHQKGIQMLFQVVMGVVVILFYSSLFERTVHPFHLAIGPGMVGLSQPMVNPMFITDAIKDMVEGVDIALPIRELDAVVGEYCVDRIGNGS